MHSINKIVEFPTYRLFMPLSSDSFSTIRPGSSKALELAQAYVLLLDEALVLPKYGLQYMDRLLRSLVNPNLPYGGKILVAGNDFRQCLPVYPAISVKHSIYQENK